MEKRKLSKLACCQLAKQLVEEQAELVKHQTLVDMLRKAIIVKKKEVIKDLVGGRILKIENRRMALLSVEVEEHYNKIRIVTWLGQEPNEAIKGLKLTAIEKKLMREYERAFGRCYNESSDSDAWSEKALYSGERLMRLKNRMSVLYRSSDYFEYDDATDPNFFNTTSIVIDRCGRGVCARETRLEDTVIRYWH